MNSFQENYAPLVHRAREVSTLGTAAEVLSWDQQTGLPSKAGAFRATQISHLCTLVHRQQCAAEVGDWLSACEQHLDKASTIEAANVREWRRNYDRVVKLPEALVSEMASLSSLAQQTWMDARQASDFSIFQPHLERLVELTRQQADYWGYTTEAYDALLDPYEPGCTAAALETLFDGLAPRLKELVLKGEDASSGVRGLHGKFPIEAQQKLNRRVAEALGYDFAAGRIDTATHPFCTTLGPYDIRLTTRYDEADFTSSLLGVLHEAGHALYEQGMRADDFGLPSGNAVSLGIHESQSRLVENHIGRSRAFWDYWMPVAQEHFEDLKDYTARDLFRHVNRVERSFIRVEADGVSYDLHIILRFRIERALFRNEITVSDLPAAWNEEFRKLFDKFVPDDRHGCLQDMHWSGAAFGYFPTYTLGNLNAAQLMLAAHTQIPGLESALALADYAPLHDWLGENIHQHGSVFLPSKLIREATGQDTTPNGHLDYLERKIGELRTH